MEVTDDRPTNLATDIETRRPSLIQRIRKSFSSIFRRRTPRKRNKSDSQVPESPNNPEIAKPRSSLTSDNLPQICKNSEEIDNSVKSADTKFRPPAKVPLFVNDFTSELKESLKVRSRKIVASEELPAEAISHTEGMKTLNAVSGEKKTNVGIEIETKTFEEKLALFENQISCGIDSVPDSLLKENSDKEDILENVGGRCIGENGIGGGSGENGDDGCREGNGEENINERRCDENEDDGCRECGEEENRDRGEGGGNEDDGCREGCEEEDRDDVGGVSEDKGSEKENTDEQGSGENEDDGCIEDNEDKRGEEENRDGRGRVQNEDDQGRQDNGNNCGSEEDVAAVTMTPQSDVDHITDSARYEIECFRGLSDDNVDENGEGDLVILSAPTGSQLKAQINGTMTTEDDGELSKNIDRFVNELTEAASDFV